MTADLKPNRSRIYRKDFWTGRLKLVGEAESGHNDSIDKVLPSGVDAPLLTEEQHRRVMSGTGSHAAHVAQALEDKED